MGEISVANSTFKYALLAGALLAVGAIAGCTSISKNVAKDGSGAAQLVWPQPADTIALHKGGTFPNLDNLRQVQAGLDKQQIMDLIGPPHFNEFIGSREWNYLFNFRKDGQVTQCEYKILFDEHKLARSFYWNPAACADILNPPAPKPVAASESFTLSADALFAFDKAGLADVKPQGRAELDALAAKLTADGAKAEHIHVVGYTDRLGSNAYNQKLSERRAATVREYLASHGVAADRIDAEGRGKADPVTTCNDKQRAKLIACLAPNRRVVVEATAAH